MRIDFHVHSCASFDCESDPAEIVGWAARKGLDALVVTEHDSTDGYTGLKAEGDKQGVTVLPGVEFSVRRGTHYLVYFAPELPLPSDDIEMIQEVHRRGGLVAVAHPYRSDTGLLYNQIEKQMYSEQEVAAILSEADCIEVFNAKSSDEQNEQARQLAQLYPRLKQIAGSDSHHPATVGAAHTEIPGFQSGTVTEMAAHIRKLPTVIRVLPELQETPLQKNLYNSIEGVRRLMVRLKPLVPERIWTVGKKAYRSASDKRATKKAARSVVE